ncbi:MAG: class I SAM-dependent methyltransferase, partial [Acidimicrobiales bacterium]
MAEIDNDGLATRGFGDGGTYERGRPGYPEEALDLFADTFGLGAGRRVVDLGAGTGKFTRQLATLGVEILADEPSPSMRAELGRNLPQVELVDG